MVWLKSFTCSAHESWNGNSWESLRQAGLELLVWVVCLESKNTEGWKFASKKRVYLEYFFFPLVVLGLCCYVRAFSCCGECGLLSSWDAQVSHRSGFCCCGAWALGTQTQLLSDMWNPLGPGIEPMSPALAGRLPCTAPPVKSVVNNAYTHNKRKASST